MNGMSPGWDLLLVIMDETEITESTTTCDIFESTFLLTIKLNALNIIY